MKIFKLWAVAALGLCGLLFVGAEYDGENVLAVYLAKFAVLGIMARIIYLNNKRYGKDRNSTK